MNKTSVKFQWCPSGHILLATTTTNFDETGHNYYGSSSLQSLYVPLTTNNTSAYPKEVFLSPTNNIFTQTLCQSEVQSATFDPTGNQPCNLTIYDTTNMNVVFAREKVFMNTLMFSPNSQFLAVAGFENLPGDVEIYEVKTFKIVCKFIAQCTSLWMWDIKNTTILCGQSYPRRKFDNKIAVFGIDGLLIEKRDFVGKFMYSFGIFGEKQMQDVVFKYIKYNENIELYSPQKR
ncbi:Eukaryotic translation initiation factor 2A [Entamoeba marina]